MLINIEPLKKYRDYRLLFFGQMISFLGSMVSYVAIPYQIYQITKDNWMVGLLGVVQLVPVLLFGILGGTYADRLNRRKMLITADILMFFCVSGLAINSLQEKPSIPAIFILVAVLQAVLGFHRPSMEALTQNLVDAKDYASVGALGSIRYSVGAIAGPAIGGLIIARFGIQGAYVFDMFSFAAALIAVLMMTRVPDPIKSLKTPWTDAKEGLRYAFSKPELVGTYLIDIVAMLFAFPVALFPAMADKWGGAKEAGIIFSAMAIGSLLATVFSGWTSKVTRHGRAVVIAATAWAICIFGLGFAPNLMTTVLFLAMAGCADMISGLFRGVIWNETVPNEMRGRLSGIEMISYMTGPLLGNTRAGWVASKYTVPISLWSGGLICTLAVILTAVFLPKFWSYKSKKVSLKSGNE